MIAVVVRPAKGPDATNHALIGEHYSFLAIHCRVSVLPCKCKPILHMIPFEIWPLLLHIGSDFFPSLIPPDSLNMDLHSIRRLKKSLAWMNRWPSLGVVNWSVLNWQARTSFDLQRILFRQSTLTVKCSLCSFCTCWWQIRSRSRVFRHLSDELILNQQLSCVDDLCRWSWRVIFFSFCIAPFGSIRFGGGGMKENKNEEGNGMGENRWKRRRSRRSCLINPVSQLSIAYSHVGYFWCQWGCRAWRKELK